MDGNMMLDTTTIVILVVLATYVALFLWLVYSVVV